MEFKKHNHIEINGIVLYTQIEAYPRDADFDREDAFAMLGAVELVSDAIEDLDESEPPGDTGDEADQLLEEMEADMEATIPNGDDELPEFNGFPMVEEVGQTHGIVVYRDEDGDGWLDGRCFEEPICIGQYDANHLGDLLAEATE